jgi:hypothetical protein
MKRNAMQKNTVEGPRPIIFLFLQPYPAHLYPVNEAEESVTYQSLDEMQAALFPKFPTTVWTNGKTRPAGYNRNGKLLPSKFIPGKSDKRSGK